jgi:hypothetical protein
VRRVLLAALIAFSATTTQAQSEGSVVSAVSIGISTGSVVLQALPEGSELVIESITAAGKASIVMVRASANGTRASFEVTTELCGKLALGAGKVVTVSANGAGNLIKVSGEVIAFVPNELGRSLIHHRELNP